MGASFSILSVNIGLPKVIGTLKGEQVTSGIAKTPASAAHLMVRATNIDGDGQADLENHGGIDKAVYAYPSDHWPWWIAVHDLACRPATFGENLTLTGGDETDVAIGDRFAWGDAILEVSQPRAPCFKLGIHARPDVPGLMTRSGRCGWYLRVVREGAAPTTGAVLERVASSGGPTVRESFATLFSPKPDLATLRRIHGAPALSPAWRQALAKKIPAIQA